ncbi:MAG TPA: Holliday junction branch migration protein RuvA [Candidatus Cloacimonas sp.]|jgi:Holliday junction DNA helicase RuvA|nr:Holliday junction branch migration protein RuvA [Candidatus Cloacimonas sp.]HNQ39869.1 Holliday junction branch migration protein RuvA [Candidatus Cloacimonas sp.]HNS84749.1 Holliday junction branch migration protein RuvA [Candidatus Cloacimonas sp.]HPH93679.1 Holliday junction branch migration protein RuvA [Candidatus Cloacimonas sp.]HQO46547.1 Holliday junction branch migration protein RuvA [Candidatus Cloacimonas sp.]
MIQYISGTLTFKTPVMAIIETIGIGWELKIPISTYEQLPTIGKPCKLLTYLHISNEDVRIFGFATEAERELFVMLNRVSGIGPKIAISILSTLSIPTFIKAVNSGEEVLLTRVPGIGKKSAQRLIVELKDDVHKLLSHIDQKELHIGDIGSEIESALLSLGFNLQQIRKELALMDDSMRKLNTEELIKEIIKRIYQRNK